MNKNAIKMMLMVHALNALNEGLYVPVGNFRSGMKESPIYIPKRQKMKGYKKGKKK